MTRAGRPRDLTLKALALLATLTLPAAARAAEPAAQVDRQTRCIALVAYAEAAIDGPRGLAAVISVIGNRLASPAYPKDACAVVLQPGQFQPVSENAELRKVLANPQAFPLEAAFGGPDNVDTPMLQAAVRLAAVTARAKADPTGGGLFFVNPAYMDPDKCSWFAGLKRTASIGGHVFLTTYRSGEAQRGPAIDCSLAGSALGAAGLRPRKVVVDIDPPPGKAALASAQESLVRPSRTPGRISNFGPVNRVDNRVSARP